MRIVRPRPLRRRPRVSVVIPCHNYGHFLPDAVASALDHEGVDVDVIIVDDASTDSSAAVAAALAARDPRVSLVRHETNAGHIATYNDGLARAEGDHVVLLSADDLLPRNALSRAAAVLEHNPEVGFVYGWAASFSGDAPAGPSVDPRASWSLWPGRQWLRWVARTGRCPITSPEVVMRREALAETDLYDPRLPHSGDFDMWMRTAARWDVARVNGPVQAHYRVHDANMHLTEYAGWELDLRARAETFAILRDERVPGDPVIAELVANADRSLRREARRRAAAAARRGDAEQAGALAQFAGVSRPGRGRARVSAPGAGGRAAAFLDGADRVRHHLAWRRERHLGV